MKRKDWCSIVICPYCRHSFRLYGIENKADWVIRRSCIKCFKMFHVEIFVGYHVTTSPCLNGEVPHKWKLYSNMGYQKCEVCGMTSEEET